MGNNWSSPEEEHYPDPWWPSSKAQAGTEQSVCDENLLEGMSGGETKKDTMENFKRELAQKRALRHEALAVLKSQMDELRSRLEEERRLRLKAEAEKDQAEESAECIRKQLEKEREESQNILEERNNMLEAVEEREGLERQIRALKDVTQIGKQMLKIRELQVKELKKKLVEINISSVIAPPEDLRLEYEKQIENIRKLRTLYEERASATAMEHRRELEREQAKITVLETKLSDVQNEVDEFKTSKTELEGKITELESTIKYNEDELDKLKDALASSAFENNTLNSKMNLINNLFSHMLVSPDVDLDRLARLLKEHHGIITDLTVNGDSTEVSALLVDLAEQIDKEKECSRAEEQCDSEDDLLNTQLQSEIASNLSKVWRVMIELLSHHQRTANQVPAGGADCCYKSIQTPAGPRSVISVSQTFLTLKDLILEKNKLVKEVGRLKTLNNHLETRLGSQEKRLSVVTTELKKTWSVVNKLKAQHKQLHTHEKILRYELQQKRCMLTELKGELEHCRDQWERARQQNSQTEEEWKKLRKEFAARKTRVESNSAESGYEDEDVQSPPLESRSYDQDILEIPFDELNKHEMADEELEHSDGNSFDTVVDCLDNRELNESAEDELLLLDVSSQPIEIPPNLLPLTSSEFTDGLDQIESEDLAAVLDIQYQNQLLGVDYNLSLPSSDRSSPIPIENDDLTSSEMDISEEDSSSNDNHVYSSPLLLPQASQTVTDDNLLFGSNSSKNISRFLEGLFIPDDCNNSESPCTVTSCDTGSMVVASESVPESEPDYDTDDHDLTPKVVEGKYYGFLNNSNAEDFEESNTGNSAQCQPESLQSLEDRSTEHVDGRSTEAELLQAREDRLKRLEHQCRSLINKVTSTSFKSEVLSNKLDELHMAHGPLESDRRHETNARAKNKSSKSNRQTSVDTEESSPKTVGVLNNTDEVVKKDLLLTENKSPDLNISSSSGPNVRTTLSDENEKPNEKTPSLSTQTTDLYKSGKRGVKSQKVLQNRTNSIHAKGGATSKLPDLAADSKEILNRCSLPGTSMEPITDTSDSIKKEKRSTEEILNARAERFKRLEDQCKSLLSKMTATSLRSEIISNKLDELHSCYGSLDDSSEIEGHSLTSKNETRVPKCSSSNRFNKDLPNQKESSGTASENSVQFNEETCNGITDKNSTEILINMPEAEVSRIPEKEISDITKQYKLNDASSSTNDSDEKKEVFFDQSSKLLSENQTSVSARYEEVSRFEQSPDSNSLLQTEKQNN